MANVPLVQRKKARLKMQNDHDKKNRKLIS